MKRPSCPDLTPRCQQAKGQGFRFAEPRSRAARNRTTVAVDSELHHERSLDQEVESILTDDYPLVLDEDQVLAFVPNPAGIELKAVSEITNIHRAQLRAYLAATGHELGLIVNFNVSRRKDNGIRRVVRTGDF